MNFNLENANFSSSDEEDEDLLVPSNEMIKEYNREYSMIVKEIQRFLKESKESVQRFVTLHNFGAGFNLPGLFDSIITIENVFKAKLTQTEKQQSRDPKAVAKHKYQISFNRLMQRMSDIIQDFLDCQLQFKKQYFGFKTEQASKQMSSRMRNCSPRAHSVSSLTNSSKSSKLKMQAFIQSEQKEEKREAELRATLNERLKPKTASVEIECKVQYSTTQNLYRLNEKIDRMIGDMRSVKNRQEKLIELFNLNRVKKIHSSQPQTPFPSTDISAISNTQENEDDVDQFLDNYRTVRKNSDSFTEDWKAEKRNFVKKSNTIFEETDQ